MEISFVSLQNKVKYNVLMDNANYAEITFKNILSIRAFFDYQDKRLEIICRKGGTLLKRGVLQVNEDGVNIIEMKTNWLGNKGELMTKWGHLYNFRLSDDKSKLLLERQADNSILIEMSKRDKSGKRIVNCNPSEIPVEEFNGIIAAILFYVIRLDMAQNIASITT